MINHLPLFKKSSNLKFISRVNFCQIYFQLLNLIVPFLLEQDYPKSIVVRKALNSLMGLSCKEKGGKKVMLKRKITYLTQTPCCAACGCNRPLGSWPAGWNTTYSQAGFAPEWFINEICFINTTHDELRAGSSLCLHWSDLQFLKSSRSFWMETPLQYFMALEMLLL